jgi:hypothetical protein
MQEKRKLQTCYNYYKAVFSPSFSVFQLNFVIRNDGHSEKTALALTFPKMSYYGIILNIFHYSDHRNFTGTLRHLSQESNKFRQIRRFFLEIVYYI